MWEDAIGHVGQQEPRAANDRASHDPEDASALSSG
jgi:hypothetical protein